MPKVFLLTGLSGAGKTTIAEGLLQKMAPAHDFILLDGDIVRKGLCADLGFTPEDRTENMRRMAEMAKLLLDQGWNVVIAAIAPRTAARENLARIVGKDNLHVIHVACPLEICIARDPKGNYKKAMAGCLPGYTGIGDIYEMPDAPDLILETNQISIEESVGQLRKFVANAIK